MRGFSRFTESRPFNFSRKKWAAVILFISLILVGSIFFIKAVATSKSPAPAANTEKVAIDKTYTFDARQAVNQDKKVPVKVTLKNVQRTDTLKSNGKTTTLNNGSRFVLVTFVIENNANDKVTFQTKDFIRYQDPNGKKFAPSIAAAGTIVEPQATKIDTVGYVEPDDIKKMVLALGPIESDKDMIEVTFK